MWRSAEEWLDSVVGLLLLAALLLTACKPAIPRSGQLYPGVEYSHVLREGKSTWITVTWRDGFTDQRQSGRFEVSCTRRQVRRIDEGVSGWADDLRWAFEPEVVRLVCGQ